VSEAKEQSQRLFVAIELPQHVCDELHDFCNQFARKKLFLGGCTRPENFHLTVKFLGEVAESVIPEIDVALETISFSTCKAHVGALDVLPSREKIRILFAHLVCPELTLLAQQIEDALVPRFDRATREFKSHVTIARIKSIDDQRKFLREVDEFVIPLMQWKIDSFVLKRSVLGKDGPLYTVVKRYHMV